MASGGSCQDTEDAISKLLQMDMEAEYRNEVRPTTLGESFSLARITEAYFEDENYKAVDNNVGDQEDPNVKDKQEVKKADAQEIKNVKDEEGKNVEDQQVSKADDDTNNDGVGYMRQPIEDEAFFCMVHMDEFCIDEDQHGSVRSIGVTINSDVADFDSEVHDSGSLGVYEL
ncbi:hypothetical protein Tco_0031262 [Tanacetum coccineum]